MKLAAVAHIVEHAGHLRNKHARGASLDTRTGSAISARLNARSKYAASAETTIPVPIARTFLYARLSMSSTVKKDTSIQNTNKQ